MLAGALCALVVVGVLALVSTHTVFGRGGSSGRNGACRDGNCSASRCARIRNPQTDRNTVSPSCPPVRPSAGEEEHARPRVSWRFVPRPGP
jgi:hypothetical protein